MIHKKTAKKLKYLFIFCAAILSTGSLFACRQEYGDSIDSIDSDGFSVPLFVPRTDENAYDIIYNAILNRENSCDLSAYGLSESEFSADYDVWQLINENPSIAYLDTYFLHTQSGIVTQLTFEYKSIPSDYDEQLERAVASAVTYVKGQLREKYKQAELVCAINDYIAVNCQYAYKSDGATPDDNYANAYSALVKSRAVCDGYAGAFTLLAQQFGLEVMKVSGTADPDNANHAWNMVKVDGIWYHVDVTWNDPTPDKPGQAGHEYLLLSDQAISNPRQGSRQYHASWNAAAPCAEDTRYDDAFWVYETAPVSFREMNFDEWEHIVSQTSFDEVVIAAVENNTEANVARFGYGAEKINEEIRKLYPYIGYTYAENSNGIVVKISDWVTD